jgi:aminoglycoside phosphotransferase (APT) family kinase protein
MGSSKGAHVGALQVNFLETLKQVLSNPALNELPDPALRTQVFLAHRVLARMLADETTTPKLSRETLAEYLTVAEGAEAICKRNGVAIDAVARLRALSNGSQGLYARDALLVARDLQLALDKIGGEEARAIKRKLVAIEARFSKGVLEVVEPLVAPQPGAATTGAVHMRPIDEAAFNAFLAQAFPNEPGLRLASYKFISGGHSKFTAKLELTGGRTIPNDVIMRADAVGTYGGASVVEEYRMLQVLHRNGIKVPKPLAVDESGKAFGATMMLVEAMPGESIGHMFVLPPRNPAVNRDVATQLARLHRIPVEQFGDKIDGATMTNQQKALEWLDKSYATFRSLNRGSPVFEAAFQWLRENVALNDGARSLVHGDYGLNNILIHDNQVSVILDWEFAHIGNPIYDLGYFYYQAESLGSFQEFLEAYRAAGGFNPTQAQIDYATLFAATRLGVMVLQSETAFEAGAIKGPAAAAANTGYYEMSVERMAGILEKVL